jgi:N-acetylneuraminic acid mutarotase
MKTFLFTLSLAAYFLLASCGGSAPGPVSSFPVAPGEWNWVSGADTAGQSGDYGTLGTAAASNVPGARSESATWTDLAGNFWLFGGGYDQSNGTIAYYFNDLWKYSAGEWTWMGGSNATDQSGTYGIEGIAAADNYPGARRAASHWTDAAGSFWLFGGWGYDSAGDTEYLNDLWRFSAGQWTWMGGSNFTSQLGVYGTPGVAAAGNIPGARWRAVQWTDTAGNFWLFGGEGESSTAASGILNDLWKFSAGEWTWMGGSNAFDRNGIYGTKGTASPANFPGARYGAANWTDAAGNFWLFGGFGYDSTGTLGVLNDLWKYSGGQWTWMSGANVANQMGIYGTQGTGAAGNAPGARDFSAAWTDAAGSFWLFSGDGFGSVAGAPGRLNDLWRYSAGQWTWMGGPSVIGQDGIYGTQGVAAPGNVPGARNFSGGWTDASGNLWLFGGFGRDSTGAEGVLNDLWKYDP